MRAPPTIEFRSPFAHRIEQFVAFKRMQGHEYRNGLFSLKRLDSFLVQEGCIVSVLHADTLNRYCADMVDLSLSTREEHQSVARQFSRYLHAFEPESAILPGRLVARHGPCVRFYPLSQDQVRSLMAATEILTPKSGIRPHCIRFLIGLLYSTGLRIAEALALNLGDVDTSDGTLFVRRGKFRKERIVPMSPSTVEALTAWLKLRKRYAGGKASAPLLVIKWNKRPRHDQCRRPFRRLCQHCGIDGDPPPRLHDLRHNYACRRIALWREEGKDVNTLLPVLANAMGHVNFFRTQVYIHVQAASLERASTMFNAHVKHHLESSK
jgi:integrase